jgi:signal transduction histidine kinase
MNEPRPPLERPSWWPKDWPWPPRNPADGPRPSWWPEDRVWPPRSHLHRQRPVWWPEDQRWPPTPHIYRHRPDWWPENEAWPPRGRRGHAFFRRIGCAFVLANLLGLGLASAAILVIARGLGLVKFSFEPAPWLLSVLAGLLVFAALAAGVGVISLRRLISPLDELLKAADRIGQGDVSVRVREHGPREVRALARAFNDMTARLHQLDEQRRALLADVTHELRNPLTVVQGNLEGMLDGVYPADAENLRRLLDETRLLSRLVEDLRTLALADAGALQLKKEPVDLATLVNETLAAFRPQAEAVDVELKTELAVDLPPLELDPGRMRQVLSNLLANALRYTPAGGSIAVRLRKGGQALELEVQDSGPGIPPDELPHVFERFYKSADSGGMGLGLAIAKHLVAAHGGTIVVDSVTGEGTTMRLSLPAA